MLQKDDIIAFFDRCAPTWDDGLVHDDAIIGTILFFEVRFASSIAMKFKGSAIARKS